MTTCFQTIFRFCLENHDDWICVSPHHGELTMPSWIWHLHIVPLTRVIVWDVTSYTSRKIIVCADGTLNSRLDIFVGLILWLYSLIEPCETLCYRRIIQDQMLPVSFIHFLIQKIFDCCPWFSHSTVVSLIENDCWMVAEELAHHYMPVTPVDVGIFLKLHRQL